MKRLWYGIRQQRHRQQAIGVLRRLERKLPSPASRFAIPFVFRGRGHFRSLRPQQVPTEIESLYRIVCQLKPAGVVEIGTAKGGTLYLWAQAASADATLVSIDMPEVGFGGYRTCRAAFYRSFGGPNQAIHLLRNDSHDPGTLTKAMRCLANSTIDFLFLDGDHSYEGVRADLRRYGPLVRPGGLIALHDILPNPKTSRIQVSRLWDEVRQRHQVEELVAPANAGRRIGIGLLKRPVEGLTV